MKFNIKLNEKECTELNNKLSFVIGSIDRVGSGFEDKERCALALLLCFKKNKMLDILSHIRYVLDIEMEKQLSEEIYDEFIERENVEAWKPPYSASKEELLKMLEDN